MLDKCWEETRYTYMYGKHFKRAFVPNTFSVVYARRESRSGGETT